ncbi:MAG: hypothetical protein ACI9ZT_000002 [Gammaproteobacteria bacterium]|jgi:hypothetical protein
MSLGDDCVADENLFILDNNDTTTSETGQSSAWNLVTDTVMGGVSKGSLVEDNIVGRACQRLSGQVSLENNGGFIQAAIDLSTGEEFDASGYTGMFVDVYGNNESYNIHLRTSEIQKPWQSYRLSFTPRQEWQTFEFMFSDFKSHRIDTPLDTSKLIRIGIVAIGRAFYADLCIGRIGFY